MTQPQTKTLAYTYTLTQINKYKSMPLLGTATTCMQQRRGTTFANTYTLIGDVRSIDLKQVPTDVNLMGILNEVLWGHLTFAKNISLEEMMDTVSNWKSKSQKAQISTDSAVANYSALPGYQKSKEAKISSSQ